MKKTNVIGFDPVPRLGVTKLLEQTVLLLLGLYRLKRVETVTTVVEYLQAHNFWRGTQPDWEAPWRERCLNRAYVRLSEGQHTLTAQGIGRLHDCCTLASAMRDSFRHLTTLGYRAVCGVGQEMGRRPFTNRKASQKQHQVQRGEYHVYVILLRMRAVAKYSYLLEKNPERLLSYPCLYVGCTGGTPETRFKDHKSGRRASQVVQDYGVCLVPDLYADLNPIRSREQAEEVEGTFAASLRGQGYTITAGHHDWV